MAMLGLMERVVLSTSSWLLSSFPSTSSPRNNLQLMLATAKGETMRLHANLEMTINELIHLASRKFDLNRENTRIVLAGCALDPNSTLLQCGVINSTLLHVIEQDGLKMKIEKEKIEVSSNSTFFVFCATCNELKQAKMRVCCSKCKSNNVLIVEEPRNLDEIVKPKCIKIKCLNNNCFGNNNGFDEHNLTNVWAEFYFKCIDHDFNEDKSPLLDMLRNGNQQSNSFCMACGGDFSDNNNNNDNSKGDLVAIFNSCNHVLCLNCFQLYLSVRLNERGLRPHPKNGYYTVDCPSNCENSEMSEIRHFKLLGKSEYEKYQRFAAEQALIEAKGFFCPTRDCGNGIIVEDNNERNVTCPECGLVICPKCGQENHDNESCESVLEAQNNEVSTSFNTFEHLSNLRTIRKISKQCPGCKVSTERSGGCMHMNCVRCNMQWCWICLGPWTRDCMANHWFG